MLCTHLQHRVSSGMLHGTSPRCSLVHLVLPGAPIMSLVPRQQFLPSLTLEAARLPVSLWILPWFGAVPLVAACPPEAFRCPLVSPSPTRIHDERPEKLSAEEAHQGTPSRALGFSFSDPDGRLTRAVCFCLPGGAVLQSQPSPEIAEAMRQGCLAPTASEHLRLQG